MDANDVELTMKRPRRDTDEVYPADDLQYENEFTIYETGKRRQNKYFAIGIVLLLLSVGALFGVKVYMVPGEKAELESQSSQMEQGTVSNNDENAKVSEALRDHKQTPAKKPHSSSYPEDLSSVHPNGNETPAEEQEQDQHSPSAGTAEESEQETNDSPEDKLKAWHEIKVEKFDGQMFEVQEVLSHDPQSFM